MSIFSANKNELTSMQYYRNCAIVCRFSHEKEKRCTVAFFTQHCISLHSIIEFVYIREHVCNLYCVSTHILSL
uniref:Uncharacterized protein n=1 Tax=Triticum urartu TaxID=4572 RepID=A0A8R7UFG9_TRIUA